LLWPSLRRREARWVAAGGAAVALALVPLTPPGIPVVAAASVALVAGLRPGREDAERIEDPDPR
jgi:predicted branched-subunit amino acid permease